MLHTDSHSEGNYWSTQCIVSEIIPYMQGCHCKIMNVLGMTKETGKNSKVDICKISNIIALENNAFYKSLNMV